MSDMYTHAAKLNEQLKKVGMSEAQLNIALEMARVAKFRCRSNTAFEGFVNAIIRDTNAKLESYEAGNGEHTFTAYRISGDAKPQIEVVA